MAASCTPCEQAARILVFALYLFCKVRCSPGQLSYHGAFYFQLVAEEGTGCRTVQQIIGRIPLLLGQCDYCCSRGRESLHEPALKQLMWNSFWKIHPYHYIQPFSWRRGEAYGVISHSTSPPFPVTDGKWLISCPWRASLLKVDVAGYNGNQLSNVMCLRLKAILWVCQKS